MKLTEKQQLLAILVGAGVLILGEVAFAWLNFNERGEIRTELAALDARQATANSKLAQIPQLRRRARELTEIVDQYTEILPRDDEVRPDAFLDDITSLCKEVGLEITAAPHGLDPNAQPGTLIAPVLDDRAGHLAGQVDRDGKTDAGLQSPDEGVDADDLPVNVHQRSAAVARVDVGIGLNEVLVQ